MKTEQILSLFFESDDEPQNLLPKEGEVYYYGKVFTFEESKKYYDYLLNEIPWKPDEAVIFGKLIETKRKVAWFGEEEFEYSYSGRSKRAMKFTQPLLDLKKKIEELTGETYNSVLLNLYHDGSEGMAYHSDGERDLKEYGAIASLTFGAERKFSFKHKTSKERIDMLLENGSLLIMKGETQKYWLHRLPPSKKIITPRINLTFRTIVMNSK